MHHRHLSLFYLALGCLLYSGSAQARLYGSASPQKIVAVRRDTVPQLDSDKMAELISKIFNLYRQKNTDWEFLAGCANAAFGLDSAYYFAHAPLYMTGEARFNIGDNVGAIKDFEHLLKAYYVKQVRLLDPVGVKDLMAQAYLRMEQPEPAAMLYANVGLPRTVCKLLKINKDYRDRPLYRRSVNIIIDGNDEALKLYETDRYNQGDKTFYPKGQYRSDLLIDYAYILLMLNKPQAALKVFSKPHRHERYEQDLLAIKDLISAMCQYMLHPASFDKVKATLTASIAIHGKIIYHEYVPFSDWVPWSDLDKDKRKRVMELEAIACGRI